MRWTLILVILLLPSTSAFGQQERNAAFDAISKTVDWSTTLSSYDVEITRQTLQTITESDTSISTARICREIVLPSSMFFICDSKGTWHLSLKEPDQGDSTKTVFRVGDKNRARAWTKGFATSNLKCPAGGCLEVARVIKWKKLPLLFELPIQEDISEKELDFIVEQLLNKELTRVVSGKNEHIKHFGKSKLASQYRFTYQKKIKSIDLTLYIGLEVNVSAEGDDEGLVIGLNWYQLKEDCDEPFHPSNIKIHDRTVTTNWEKRNFAIGEVLVPVRVDQSHASQDDGDKLFQTTSFDWKDTEKTVQINERGFEVLMKDNEARVDKLLNR